MEKYWPMCDNYIKGRSLADTDELKNDLVGDLES
jgi:hypothetical protein